MIDASAQIDPSSIIGPNVVIGAGCKVGPGNCIKGSTLLAGSSVGSYSLIDGSIVAGIAQLESGAESPASPLSPRMCK